MLARERMGGVRGWLLLRLRHPALVGGPLLLRGLSLLPLLALHVDAAPEVRALRDRDARRDDVAVHRSAVADFHLLGRAHVAIDFAEDDERLGEYLRLDLAIGTNRQHVILELDLAFDLSFDREVLAAVQFAFDDDRLPDVHDIPPDLVAGLLLRRRG